MVVSGEKISFIHAMSSATKDTIFSSHRNDFTSEKQSELAVVVSMLLSSLSGAHGLQDLGAGWRPLHQHMFSPLRLIV